MDEAAAAFDALAPQVVVTYAEAGGWRRALVLEARRRGVPTVGLQHGFISRHWLNYQHEEDEIVASSGNPADRGCPLPDLTLLYDEFARDHLRTVGRYPADRLRVTGNPRLEAIVAAAGKLSVEDVGRAREAAGARDGQHLVLLAAKHIPDFDATFAALIRAVAGMPDVHLAIRPHPAETPDPYARLAGGVANVTVVPLSLDPVALIAGARLVATVNSTVALEAMALDVPALAMRLPNYLSPFVDAGVMAGTSRLEEIGPAVARLVRDERAREELAAKRRAYASRSPADGGGGAAARAADAILQLAGSRRWPVSGGPDPKA
jgi:UDP-N-acetylglucosamine 2-epimerase